MLCYAQLGKNPALYKPPLKFLNPKGRMRDIYPLQLVGIRVQGIQPRVPGHRRQVFFLLQHFPKLRSIFAVRIGQGINSVHAIPLHQKLGQLDLISGSLHIHLRQGQVVCLC